VADGWRRERRTASSASDEEITGPRDTLNYIVALRVDKASAREPNAPVRSAPEPVVALLPWGDIDHDFLRRLGVTLDEFRDEFTGSWMFGYVAALRTAGIATVIVCPTTSVSRPRREVHGPTGARLVLLPAPRGFATLRRLALRGRVAGRRDPETIARAAAAHLAPYLSTPPVRLRRLLQEERCSAVLCQDYENPRFDVCVAVARRARTPVFGTFQGGDEHHSRLERWTRPRALAACAGLVVAPDAEAERVSRRYGIAGAKVARVPNPVDSRLWGGGDREAGRAALGIPADALIVAWHGQVQLWRKGLDSLLEAWALLGARTGSDLRLVLVGAGEDLGELHRRIRASSLSGIHVVENWVQDRRRLADLLAAADVYAFPSRHEGLAVAPLEALAAGLPVVASDARGASDAVGDAGLVVPTGDAYALAAAIGELLDDPVRRAELARRARERVAERYSLEAVGGALRTFLLPEAGS
jgi:starch synthase